MVKIVLLTVAAYKGGKNLRDFDLVYIFLWFPITILTSTWKPTGGGVVVHWKYYVGHPLCATPNHACIGPRTLHRKIFAIPARVSTGQISAVLLARNPPKVRSDIVGQTLCSKLTYQGEEIGILGP